MTQEPQAQSFPDGLVPDGRMLAIFAKTGGDALWNASSADDALHRAITSFGKTLGYTCDLFGDRRPKDVVDCGFVQIVAGLIGISDAHLDDFGELLMPALKSYLSRGNALAGRWGRIGLDDGTLVIHVAVPESNPLRVGMSDRFRKAA